MRDATFAIAIVRRVLTHNRGSDCGPSLVGCRTGHLYENVCRFLVDITLRMRAAAHDELFVNDTHLAKLLNSEYAFLEVPSGTVVIAGLPKMYYGSAIMSAGAALNQARQKENERARFEAEAGKTYYFKWTSGTMATMIKVTPVAPEVGAKEIRKLHLSKPVDDKEEAKPETKDADKPPAH